MDIKVIRVGKRLQKVFYVIPKQITPENIRDIKGIFSGLAIRNDKIKSGKTLKERVQLLTLEK